MLIIDNTNIIERCVPCHYRGTPLPLQGVGTALHPWPPSLTCSLSLQGNAPTIVARADSVTPRATKSHMFSVITGECPYHCGACGQRYTQGHQVPHVLCHCRGTPLPLRGVRTALHPGPPSPTCSLSLQGNAPTTAGRVDSVTPRATKSHMFSVIAGERPYHCGACGQRYTQGHQVPHVLCHYRGMPLPLRGVRTALHPGPPSLTYMFSVIAGECPYHCGACGQRYTQGHQVTFSDIAGERPYHCGACGQRYTHGHQVRHVLCHCRGTPLPLRGVRTALHPGPPSLTCSVSLQENAPTTAGRADSVTPRATKSHMFSVIAVECPYHCGACGQRYTHGHHVSHVLCHCRRTPLPLRGMWTALHPGPPSQVAHPQSTRRQHAVLQPGEEERQHQGAQVSRPEARPHVITERWSGGSQAGQDQRPAGGGIQQRPLHPAAVAAAPDEVRTPLLASDHQPVHECSLAVPSPPDDVATGGSTEQQPADDAAVVRSWRRPGCHASDR